MGPVFDPGCGFLRLFQESTPFGFQDIHMVLVTHDHVDHCQDLGTLVSLLRQFNKWRLDRIPQANPHTLDLVMSLGVAAQYASVLRHPENIPFLRCGKVLPPGLVEQVQKPPSTALGVNGLSIGGWQSPQRELCQFYNEGIEKKYSITQLHTLRTKHAELLGEHTGMGLKFELLAEDPDAAKRCTILISSDTATDPQSKHFKASDLIKAYTEHGDLDLLVLHVGSMEKLAPNGQALKRESEHLGLLGTVEILRELDRCCTSARKRLPRAVALTEWGYEFGRLGLSGRSEFTKLVAIELGSPQFFAAVKGEAPQKEGVVSIIPADINLRFRLPDLKRVVRRRPDRERLVRASHGSGRRGLSGNHLPFRALVGGTWPSM